VVQRHHLEEDKHLGHVRLHGMNGGAKTGHFENATFMGASSGPLSPVPLYEKAGDSSLPIFRTSRSGSWPRNN
jgi:hypothetical protein